MPEVSVIIPLYNGKNYIAETIDSILAQTYKDHEIIVVDDGSTDGSSEVVLSRYKDKVRYFRQPNSGISAARNAAILVANGNFAAFIDHDDKWLPDKLEKEMRLFSKDAKLGIVYSNGFIVDESLKRRKTFFDIEKPSRGYVFYDLLKANFIPVLSAVVKMTALDETGLFDIKFSITEDWDLFLRIAKRYTVDYIDEPLVEYRVHGDSFSRRRILMLKEVNQIADSYSDDKRAKKIIANHRSSLGLAYLSRLDRANARQAFKEALGAAGISPKPLIGMALSFLPDFIVRRVRAVTGTGAGIHESVLEKSSNRKVRLLYVIDTSDIGGTGIQVMRLMQHIDHDRFDIFLVCPAGGELVKLYKRYAKKVYELSEMAFFSLSAIRQVARIIEKENIDIVHSKLFTSDFCAAMAAGFKNRVFVSTIVGFNFFYMRGNAIEKIKKGVESWLYRIIYRSAQKVIAVSQAVKDDLARRPGIKVDPDKIEVVYCGVPKAELRDPREIRSKYSLGAGDRVICCAGSLFYGKGQVYLLRSAPSVLKNFPRVKFFLIGDGPEREALEKEAEALGVRDSVVFTGNLPEKEKDEVLYLSEIVTLPSLSEGCPQVILEAMAFAKPVIATNVGGIPELVKDRESGILVRVKDPDALSGALMMLLADPEMEKRMGSKGRSIYQDNFSVEKMAKSTAQVYLSLLERQAR